MTSASAFPYDDIVERLTVKHIQTPKDRLMGFSESDAADEARMRLKERRFDFGPVTRDGALIGRTGLAQLGDHEGSVGDRFEPLSEQFLISAGSSIRSAMRWLAHDRWLLVVDGREITGIVTPSDLNRQAARAYFYLLVADFELRLADAIRDTFEDQLDTYQFLSDRDVGAMEERVNRARRGDIDSDIVASMYLWNLVAIATASAEVRQRLNHVRPDDWKWASREVNGFRRKVMHPVNPLLSDTSGLTKLIEIEERLRRLAGDGYESERREEVA